MKRSAGSRNIACNLSKPVHQRLGAYALAAGATGVSLLALAQPSEAEIVYTPANQTVGRNGSLKLDLNHDGVTDFTIFEHVRSQTAMASAQSIGAMPGPNNHVKCLYAYCASTEGANAAALNLGSEIGSSPTPHGWAGGGRQDMAFEGRSGGRHWFSGDWQYARSNYLGLRFQINGETHYGWARLSVSFDHGSGPDRSWEIQLTGYAYETIAGKSIEAGQTTEQEDRATESPRPANLIPASSERRPDSRSKRLASLASLALGASGLALWRRAESEGE
jgi:hypothetical protein